MTKYTCCDKAYIRGLREGGMAMELIAKKFDVTAASIYKMLTRDDLKKSTESPKPLGRPPKLSERDKRQYAIIAKRNRRATLGEITNEGPANVSTRTVRKALHEQGLNNRVAKKKPYLKPEHVQKRKLFVKNMEDWTLEDFKRVVWTDESSFELGKNTRQTKVWRMTDEAYLEDCLQPTFKSSRLSVMVWGAISWGKKSNLVVLEKGRTTSKDFIEQVYEGELGRFMGEVDEAILMEDGAPVHRSKISNKWKEDHGIEQIVWPPQSPDMNPIENFWNTMKVKVQKKFQMGMTMEKHIEVIRETWEEIDVEEINNLISSMLSRLQQLKKKRGKSTKY